MSMECEATKAVWSCDKCAAKLCDSCNQLAHRLKIHQAHLPVLIEDDRFALLVKCSEHGLEYTLYCTEDSTIICLECVSQSHYDHRHIGVADEKNAASERFARYNQNVEDNSEEIGSLESLISHVEQYETKATSQAQTYFI